MGRTGCFRGEDGGGKPSERARAIRAAQAGRSSGIPRFEPIQIELCPSMTPTERPTGRAGRRGVFRGVARSDCYFAAGCWAAPEAARLRVTFGAAFFEDWALPPPPPPPPVAVEGPLAVLRALRLACSAVFASPA